MRAAFDEIITAAVKCQHEPQRVVGDLLSAEINEKQARSIQYQLTLAKLLLAKDVDDFCFDGTPVGQSAKPSTCSAFGPERSRCRVTGDLR